MALSFVVEDGTGLPTATSYLSVAEAEDILSLNPVFFATWSGLDGTEKETYLMWASRYIDQHIDWNGRKTVETSSLRWPRTCVVDADKVAIPDDIVPEQVKRATAQLVVFLQSSESARSGGQSAVLPEGIKRVQADVVEVEFFEDGGSDSRAGTDLLPVNMRFLVNGIGHVMTGKQRMAKAVR